MNSTLCDLVGYEECEEGDGDDRTFTRTDPIIVEMNFTVDDLPSGRKGMSMDGRAYPGVSSGGYFGHGEPLWKGNRSLTERIDLVIESELKWLRASYPLRPLELRVTRPDRRQLTLDEVGQC